MAKILSVYTKLLAGLSGLLALLWAYLAVDGPVPLEWLLGSSVLVWGPALWFVYLALRFGNPRSAARFYAVSIRPWGRLKIIIFGFAGIGSLALGAVVGSVILHPEMSSQIGRWIPITGLAAAMLYMLAAHFGSRALTFATGQVEFEGEQVFQPGTTLEPGALRYPYRG